MANDAKDWFQRNNGYFQGRRRRAQSPKVAF